MLEAPIRPLSTRSCWVIFNWADSDLPEDVKIRISAVEKHRLKDRLRKLSHASDPLPLVRAWFAHRADPRRLRASADDLADLRADRRLVLSGVSHPEAGLLAGNEVEGYVSAADLQDLVDDYLLVEPRQDSPANVVLHVFDEPEDLSERGVPPLALAADLAERPGVREQNAARELIRRALANHPA